MTRSHTLDRFILEGERAHPGATGELSLLLMRFGVAGKRIARELALAGLRHTLGSAGSSNVQGEEQKKLDVIANEILLETFDYGGLVTAAASEELEEPFVYRGGEEGSYAVLFDPMDGSSNIDVNGTLGTIFSIRRRREGTVADLLRPGHDQVAAGYVLFGPAVIFVYTAGDGLHLFTLDPSIGEFLLTERAVRMPPRGRGYAANEGRSKSWPAPVRAFVDYLKEKDPATGRPYSTRYSGSMVGDVHRFLLEGGIYFYPAEHVPGGKPKGKLRVLYECHPMAFAVEQAGGKASTGTERILDVVPEGLHARAPMAIGSAAEVELFESFSRGRAPRALPGISPASSREGGRMPAKTADKDVKKIEPHDSGMVSGFTARTAGKEEEDTLESYTVREGDSLRSIAARLLGKASLASALREANRDLLPDPALVRPGQVLRIPKL